jgi:hypothetical protein
MLHWLDPPSKGSILQSEDSIRILSSLTVNWKMQNDVIHQRMKNKKEKLGICISDQSRTQIFSLHYHFRDFISEEWLKTSTNWGKII